MKIVERQVGDVVILDLHGKILIGEGDDALREAVTKLADSGKTKILLNLADVPYVDSAGLGEIVRTYTTVSRKGGQLKLLNLTKKIQDLLSITKLLTVFETYDAEDEAVRSFKYRARAVAGPGPAACDPMSLARALFVSLRPHQWTKNLVVLAALVFSKHLFDADALPSARAGVRGLLRAGRRGLSRERPDRPRARPAAPGQAHAADRERSAAAGRGARGRGAAARAASLAASLALGPGLPGSARSRTPRSALAYSLALKHVVILDVLAVALGFVLRAVAGAVAIGVHFSAWLLVCTLLLALFLALAKRRHELVTLEDAAAHRQILAEYSPYLLDQMIAVVTASCLTAYAFYTLAPETVEKYRTERLALTIPFVIYGIFRYLYLVHHRGEGGSPGDVLLTDRPLLVAVALCAVVMVLIVYTAPGIPVPRVN